ncbi:MAG TPA: transposase [Nitrospirota bacterium]|nr:transposase [Nitrospirota bacterium]
MQVLKAYRYRLKTNPDLESAFRKFSGCTRFVWNKALAVQKDRLSNGQRCRSYEDMTSLLPSWKKELPFLKEAHSQILQQRMKDLADAINAVFSPDNPKGFPKFKKKHKSASSFRYPQGFVISGNRIFLPKIGWVRFFKSREIVGKPKNCTVSEHGGYWYISVQTESVVPEPVPPSSSAIGVDMGKVNIVALSNGDKKEPVSAYNTMMERLAKLQRRLARMVKRSNNWKKQKLRIKRLHARIADIRNGHLHNISSDMSKNHALVFVEKLPVKIMTKSAKGTVDRPGNQVKRKSALNRAILDQGWYELRRQLEYKLRFRGGSLHAVPPENTSQTCSNCFHVSPENRPSRSLFYCTKCGHTEDADVNAAKNILRVGLTRLACGSNGAVMPSEAGTYRVSACADNAGIIGL